MTTPAASQRPLQLADLLTLRLPREPRLSPDGSRAVFALESMDAAADDYRLHLWLASPEGARALTRGRVQDHGARWSPDGTRLAFLSARGDESGVWLLDLAGGEPQKLFAWTDRSASSLAWSPDGTRLALLGSPKPPKPEGAERAGDGEPLFRRIRRLSYRVDGAGWLSEERGHVYVVEVPRGADWGRAVEPRRLTDGAADDGFPSWTADGREVLFTGRPDIAADAADRLRYLMPIHAVPADGSAPPRRISTGPGGFEHPLCSPDGRWVVAVGNRHDEDQWGTHDPGLWLFPMAGGEGVCLTPELDRPVGDHSITDLGEDSYSVPQFVGDGREILFPLSDRGAVAVWRVALDGHGGAVSAPEPVWHGPQLVTDAHWANGRLLAMVADPVTPPDLFAADYAPGGRLGEVRAWTRFQPEWLAPLALTAPREFETRAADGFPVHGWLLPPLPGRYAGETPPALLQIHGGPHGQYAWCFMFEFHYLAAQGYAVIYTNPRGSVGYGLDAAAPVLEHMAEFPVRDLHAAVDWAVAERLADPDRLGVLGGSGGGYLTSWLVAHGERFRAAASMRALNDWRTFFGTSDMGWVSPWMAGGGTPWDDPERYRELSPLSYAENVRTPLLIVHNEHDWRCNPEQAEQLFAWLRYLGREVEMLRFPEESHGLSRGGTPSRRLERLRSLAEWFARRLPVAASPVAERAR